MSGRNGTETRRSGRVTLRVPLKIYEPDTNNRFLVEETYALKVSLWGGQIALRAAVRRDQQLVLVNQATGATPESRVVSLGPLQLGGRRARLVALEFLRAVAWFLGHRFSFDDSMVPGQAHVHIVKDGELREGETRGTSGGTGYGLAD